MKKRVSIAIVPIIHSVDTVISTDGSGAQRLGDMGDGTLGGATVVNNVPLSPSVNVVVAPLSVSFNAGNIVTIVGNIVTDDGSVGGVINFYRRAMDSFASHVCA